MTHSAAERTVYEALCLGPLTLLELELHTDIPRGTLESAVRTLRAYGSITVKEIRFRGRRGGSGRPARVYQLAGTPA